MTTRRTGKGNGKGNGNGKGKGKGKGKSKSKGKERSPPGGGWLESGGGGEDFVHIYPLRGVVAGVAGCAVAVVLLAGAGVL